MNTSVEIVCTEGKFGALQEKDERYDLEDVEARLRRYIETTPTPTSDEVEKWMAIHTGVPCWAHLTRTKYRLDPSVVHIRVRVMPCNLDGHEVEWTVGPFDMEVRDASHSGLEAVGANQLEALLRLSKEVDLVTRAEESARDASEN